VAELERKKGIGIVLKQPLETAAFLSQASYPLILIPWENQTLVFDALNTTTYTAKYRTVSDAEEFLENLRSRSKTLETFMAFLSDNENYFRQPQSDQRIALNGLVVDPSLLSELGTYIDEAKQADSLSTEQIVPSVVVNEDVIASARQELENLRSKLKEDLNSLYAGVKLQGRTSEGFLKTLRTETKTVQNEYDERIREQEKIVGPDVSRTSKEYDLRITELSRKFERQLAPLQREKVKLDRASEQTRAIGLPRDAAGFEAKRLAAPFQFLDMNLKHGFSFGYALRRLGSRYACRSGIPVWASRRPAPLPMRREGDSGGWAPPSCEEVEVGRQRRMPRRSMSAR